MPGEPEQSEPIQDPEYRPPQPRDGQAIWRLVERSGALDLNSPYAYLMACANFPDTCVVALEGGRLCGFVVGYVVPVRPDAVFVWQVGVDEGHRGRGIGGTMLDELVAREACRNVEYLEATVTPSNDASRSLFEGFAKRHDTSCEERPFLAAEDFPGEHEEEVLLRIGPLSVNRRKV